MPQNLYLPFDAYWRREGHLEVFSSSREAFVPLDDSAFRAWSADGRQPTPWPKDEHGIESDAEMAAVLAPFGLTLPGHEPAARANFPWVIDTLTRVAAKTAV